MSEIDEGQAIDRHRIPVPRWLVGLVVLWICGITATSGWGLLRQERITDSINREIVERREAACNDASASRSIIRQMSKDASIEVGEALIEVAQSTDEEVVTQFREVMDRRLTAIVNQLPSRRWDPRLQECVDAVRTGERGG